MSKVYKQIKLASSPLANSKVLIIYTGGTFGMVYNDKDVLVPFDFEQVLDKVPALKGMGIDLTVFAFDKPVDSSNIGIAEWQDMARMIYDNYSDFDGFVILHGTDTMAYSASAVSFMLEGLDKPVIFTGAQIPIGATRSDARENLITALMMASTTEGGKAVVREVAILFDYKLIRGNRAQKSNTNQFDAFRSENYPVLADAGVEISYKDSYLLRNNVFGKLVLWPQMDEKVAVLRVFPQMPRQQYESLLLSEELKGIVMESFGSGNVMAKPDLLDLLEKRISEGLLVVNVSQCTGGRVVQDRYQTGRQLSKIGVMSGHDMTTEAALTKLMHLLGRYEDVGEIRNVLKRSIRGEMTVLQ